jgi:hypothetical protein
MLAEAMLRAVPVVADVMIWVNWSRTAAPVGAAGDVACMADHALERPRLSTAARACAIIRI